MFHCSSELALTWSNAACLSTGKPALGAADWKWSSCLLQLCDEAKAEFIYCLQRQYIGTVSGFCWNLASYFLCDGKPDFFKSNQLFLIFPNFQCIAIVFLNECSRIFLTQSKMSGDTLGLGQKTVLTQLSWCLFMVSKFSKQLQPPHLLGGMWN